LRRRRRLVQNGSTLFITGCVNGLPLSTMRADYWTGEVIGGEASLKLPGVRRVTGQQAIEGRWTLDALNSSLS